MNVNLATAHGTARRYWAGCRCDFCKAGEAYYHRQKRSARPKTKCPLLQELKARDAARARYARWRVKHVHEVRESQKRYREKHREDIRARHKRWRDKNPEKLRLWGIQRRDSNQRARRSGVAGRHYTRDVKAQYERQRGRCFWCGVKVGDAYHTDHVVPLALGGSNGPENIVVACPACNMSKHAMHPMDWDGRLL